MTVFRMFSKMDGDRLPVTSDSAIPLPEILRSGVRKNAAVSLKIPGLPIASRKAKITHYRVDETHGNSFTLWKSMSEPQKPTPEQYAELEAAGKLAELGPATETPIADHTASLDFSLRRQGVSLQVLVWE